MSGYQQSELERLLHGLVRIGTVEELGEGGQVKVSSGELLSAWLHRSVMRAGDNQDWQPLDIGEQVIVLCPSGDFAQGIIIGSLYQEAHPAPSANLDETKKAFKDGTTISYDREKHLYNIDVKGDDATLNITSSGVLNITTVGDISVKTDANATVTAGKDVTVKASGKANVTASKIGLNGGAPCVTTAHMCHFTGSPHGDGSSTVTAGK